MGQTRWFISSDQDLRFLAQTSSRPTLHHSAESDCRQCVLSTEKDYRSLGLTCLESLIFFRTEDQLLCRPTAPTLPCRRP